MSRHYPATYTKYKSFAEHGFPDDELCLTDYNQSFNRALWERAAEVNLHGLLADSTYGGSGMSVKEACTAMEGFSSGSKHNGLTFSIAAHLAACVFPLNQFGNREQKHALLAKMATGKSVGCNAITEKNSGSDVWAMESTAVRQNNHYVLNGCKAYITNAPVADYMIVFAKTAPQKGFFGGISGFLIPASTPGISISAVIDKMGLRTCLMADVRFDEVIVPFSSRLGEEGSGAIFFNTAMIIERTIMSAINLGQLERVFRRSVEYCKLRRQKGTALIGFTHIAHQLADIATQIEAGRGLVYAAADAIDSKSKEALLKAAMAKSFVSAHAINGIKALQEIHGAYGYTTEGEIEREYRDIVASSLYSGTNHIQKNIIAQHV